MGSGKMLMGQVQVKHIKNPSRWALVCEVWSVVMIISWYYADLECCYYEGKLKSLWWCGMLGVLLRSFSWNCDGVWIVVVWCCFITGKWSAVVIELICWCPFVLVYHMQEIVMWII